MRQALFKHCANARIAGNCGNPIKITWDSHNYPEKSSRKRLDFSSILWKTEVFHIRTTLITPRQPLKCGKPACLQPVKLDQSMVFHITTAPGVLSKKTIIKKIKKMKNNQKDPLKPSHNAHFYQKLSILVTIILPKSEPLLAGLSRHRKTHFSCFLTDYGVKCLTISYAFKAFIDELFKAIITPGNGGFIVKNQPEQQKTTIKH